MSGDIDDFRALLAKVGNGDSLGIDVAHLGQKGPKITNIAAHQNSRFCLLPAGPAGG